MENKKAGTFNVPTQNLIGVLSSLPTDSVSMQNKGSDFHEDKQHPCTICGNWTRCLGYTQWMECKSRILRKEVQDE